MVCRAPATAEDVDKMCAHNQGAPRMIVAGPCKSKTEVIEATRNVPKSPHGFYVWQCSP